MLQVKQDFKCLYCNDRCHPFQSLEAVRKHMISKAHCKVHYGDGDDDEEGELEDFYDYTSRFNIYLLLVFFSAQWYEDCDRLLFMIVLFLKFCTSISANFGLDFECMV